MKRTVMGAVLLMCSTLSINAEEKRRHNSYSEAIRNNLGDLSFSTSENVEPHYRYQSGSIGKFACTLAAFQLQKEGLLSLDSTIGELLPDYKGGGKDTVTLRHLLANRSGLVEGIMVKLREDRSLISASIPSMEAANLFAAENLSFQPGEKFEYIITNWVFVQAILEKVSGNGIADVLKQYVFKPAEMAETNVFVGQINNDYSAKTSSPAMPLPNFVTCAGGLSTTPSDLIKLVKLPYENGYISEEDLMELHKVSTPEENYTLGGRIEKLKLEDEEHIVSWQSGTNGDYRSMAVYDPITKEGYALMTTDHDYDFLAKKRAEWLISRGYDKQAN